MAERPAHEDLLVRIEELENQLADCLQGWPESGATVDFRGLAERSRDAIYHYDLDKRDFLFVNRIFCDFFGLVRGKIHETPIEDIYRKIHPDDRAEVRRTIMESLEPGTTGGEVEYRIVQPDGSIRWVDDRWMVLRGDGGRAQAMEGHMRDTTQRKTADAELESSKQKALIGSYIAQDRRLVYVNPEFVRITGYSAEELNMMHPLDVVHEDYRDFVRENAIRMLKGELADPYEFCAVSKNGQIRWAMETVTSIQYRGRRASLGYFMDVTRLREAQQNLVSLGLMVGAVSHSLKACLTGLDAGLYLIDTGFYRNAPARIEEGLETARMMVDRVGKLVYEILYYVKEREIESDDVDVLQFSNEVATSIATKMRGADVDFSCRYSPPLGKFRVDREVLRSALINILDNALEACIEDEHEKKHTIEFSVHGQADQVLIDVSDNGPGMDSEQLKHVFRMFFSSKGRKGTGLGLFITRQVINQHGGTIRVESAPGEGTTFRIGLPRRPQKSDAHELPAAAD